MSSRASDYLVLHSPSSNGVAQRLIGVATNGIRATLRDSNLPPRFWIEAVATFQDANEDERGDNAI